MFTFILIIHIIVSLLLIIVVLMQQSQGGMSAMLGGGGQDSLFGASGAGSLMTKITTVLAVVFMVTSLSMAIMSKGSTAAADQGIPEAPVQQTAPVQNIPADAGNNGNIPIIPQPSGETTE